MSGPGPRWHSSFVKNKKRNSSSIDDNSSSQSQRNSNGHSNSNASNSRRRTEIFNPANNPTPAEADLKSFKIPRLNDPKHTRGKEWERVLRSGSGSGDERGSRKAKEDKDAAKENEIIVDDEDEDVFEDAKSRTSSSSERTAIRPTTPLTQTPPPVGESSFLSRRKVVTVRKSSVEDDKLQQAVKNMDNLTVEKYVKWLGQNYTNEGQCNPSVDVMPLFFKFLSQKEVFVMMQKTIDEIRSNGYIMENQTTIELFREISKMMTRIVEADLNNVQKTYHSFLNILDANGQLKRQGGYLSNPIASTAKKTQSHSQNGVVVKKEKDP